MNGKQSIITISFMNEDSLTIENLYDQHSTDTNSFISPSEKIIGVFQSTLHHILCSMPQK